MSEKYVLSEFFNNLKYSLAAYITVLKQYELTDYKN